MFPHCSKVTKSILCLRSGQSEALKRLDGHHLRLPQLVTGKPRTFLRSGYSRKALDSCSVAAQTYSSYSSLAQKICASEFHTAKFWVHMLKARPRRRFKDRAHSLCFSLSPLLAPHWHCLTLHRSGELKGTEEVLSNLQNCQEEGKLSIRGWWVLW